MTDDLAAWLLEQIAEDDRVAGDLAADGYPIHDGRVLSVKGASRVPWPDRWHPVRVLAECGAKRRIVDMHESEDVDGRLMDGEEIIVPCCVVCRDENGLREEAPCPTLRLLALPYADRPGYRPEWRP